MCEMRTCKTCGETKPLEEGFYKTGSEYSLKVSAHMQTLRERNDK